MALAGLIVGYVFIGFTVLAIVLGQALRSALGDKSGISRYGDALVPLDEALAQAVVDISGRR